ncbi:NADP-dependent oxidoreductase [Rhodococcus aerolatus]
MDVNREVRLARRPMGSLRPEDLDCVVVDAPRPGPGEVLVRTTHHSVDAAVRLRLDPVSPPGYLPAYAVGDTLEGLAVGEVVESRHPGFAEGDLVQHARGFRDLAVVDPAATALGGAGVLTRLDPALAPPDVQLVLLGGSGMTAHAGLVRVAAAQAGETVWVSSAAGSVGGIVVQLARARGCRVVGSAGSRAKVRHVLDVLDADAAFDHHEDLSAALYRCAPEGIDVYFDNVGGAHLQAALDHLRPRGRVALCGAVSGYDGGPAPAVTNLFQATSKNLRLQGFRAGAYAEHADAVRAELADLWRRGALTPATATYVGLERAPEALVDLLAGRTTGKCVITSGTT